MLLACATALAAWSGTPDLLPRGQPRARCHVAASDGGGLARIGSQLEDALSSLQPSDQYNAVLESLLTQGRADASNVAKAVDLVGEMTARRLKLSSASLKALVDANARADGLSQLLEVISAARANGACSSFASSRVALGARPSAAELGALAAVPEDSGPGEVGAALAFLGVVGGTLALELADLIDFFLPGEVSAPPLPLVVAVAAGGLAYDRYSGGGAAAALVGRGLSRLFERDLQRESEVESASFLVGYLLGLPCMPFVPAAVRSLEMLAELELPMSELLPKPPRLIDRLLIWQLAAVAVEQQAYSNLLKSEPKLPLELLQAARRREASLGIDVQQGGWNPDEDEERVRWAYAEAKRILQRFSGLRKQLQEQMSVGVSVGDCVTLIEEQLQSQRAFL